ncbi:MAG: 30S ribosomal protein S9 [Acidobacteriota bacterium]
MEKIQFYGTGKRKCATARCFMMPGSGQIVVNNRDFKLHFCNRTQQIVVESALTLTETRDKFDLYINVRGGGYSCQAGAIRLGVSRALQQFDFELRPRLKKAGFLSRDPRVKERKKYGQPGARKRFQFSKR